MENDGPMANPLVGVILGSRDEFEIMRGALESLRVMGVPYILEMSSPQRSPQRVEQFAIEAGQRGIEVIICSGTGNAQLAGMIACHTTLPIIGVPVDLLPINGGSDALHAIAHQPTGAPVAVVGINDAENAALLATQILALKYPVFRPVLAHARLSLAQRLECTYKELRTTYPDLCDPQRTAVARHLRLDSDTDTDPNPDENETPDEGAALKIHPGQIFVPGPSKEDKTAAGRLLQTPVPQEPGHITEDDDDEEMADSHPSNGRDSSPFNFPPPPSDLDLSPAFTPIRSRESRPGFAKPLESVMERALTVIDTKVFEIDREEPDEDILSHAMIVVLEGGIVAFPTDTVYGLAADATNPKAVDQLYKVKGQNAATKSLSVLIPNQDMLDQLVKEVPAAIESVLERYWPGALTVIFTKNSKVFSTLSQSPSIAVRIPDDPIALRLLESVQRPMAVINAAVMDSPAATDGKQVLDRFDTKVDCILDAGSCRGGAPSTVLSVIAEPYEVLREGAIPKRDLKRILRHQIKD